jgi:hypothetical protein
MNVLAGLAEGVLDAILERGDDPRRDPFAVALARYRSGGLPDEAAASWRSARRAARGGGDPTSILRKLDRDLLSGVVGYATGEAIADPPAETAEGADLSPTLAVVGSGGPMPSLEMAADGTWHVAASAATPEARESSDAVRASVPTLASRYPAPRRAHPSGLRAPTDPTTR